MLFRLIIVVMWGVSIVRFCNNRGKSVPLALGIYAVLVSVILFVVPNPIMPGTISALVTFGIMTLVPSRSSPATAATTAVAPAPVGVTAEPSLKICSGCKSSQKADAVRCLECGRAFAGA